MKVIAITGASGSGKTSVVKQMSLRFSCPYLLFDDYVDSNTYPKDIKRWFERGANLSEITTPRLVSSLNELKEKSSSPFLFIEEPFGRLRNPMSPLIDDVILLDIPMEVCLSRVIMRNLNNPSNDSLASISNYLGRYDDHFRDIYIHVTERNRQSCDLIIQELGRVELTADLISQWLLITSN